MTDTNITKLNKSEGRRGIYKRKRRNYACA
jgi:hypothetical protein